MNSRQQIPESTRPFPAARFPGHIPGCPSTWTGGNSYQRQRRWKSQSSGFDREGHGDRRQGIFTDPGDIHTVYHVVQRLTNMEITIGSAILARSLPTDMVPILFSVRSFVSIALPHNLKYGKTKPAASWFPARNYTWDCARSPCLKTPLEAGAFPCQKHAIHAMGSCGNRCAPHPQTFPCGAASSGKQPLCAETHTFRPHLSKRQMWSLSWGNLIRTDDIPGMNRVLYQLSYAAMCRSNSFPPNSLIIIGNSRVSVKRNFELF